MRYDGGKGAMGVAQWIINQIPPHRVYIEPFLGGGAVLRLKMPARSSIALERDARRAISLWANGHGIPDLRVIHGDAISWLENFKPAGDEFIYCDPPYLFSTRQGGAVYGFELSDREHKRLLAILRRLDCSIAISGYWSELYARALADWRTSTFLTTKRNHARAEEWLWMNYPEPLALHDYRYLGRNFRERERIKRKKLRWKNRLTKMPLMERQALLATIAECGVDRSCIVGNEEFGRVATTSTIDVGIGANGEVSGNLHRCCRRAAPAEIAAVGEE
jgi:DNA adenine methylase